jgi:hypothetical protein
MGNLVINKSLTILEAFRLAVQIKLFLLNGTLLMTKYSVMCDQGMAV